MKVQHALAALPFVGILAGMFFANSVEPYVLGLPFAMFWVVLWVVLAAEGPGHHRLVDVVRLDLLDGGGMDRRGRPVELRRRLGRPRLFSPR